MIRGWMLRNGNNDVYDIYDVDDVDDVDDEDDDNDVQEVRDNTRNDDDVARVCTRRSSTRNWHLPVETRRGRGEGAR